MISIDYNRFCTFVGLDKRFANREFAPYPVHSLLIMRLRAESVAIPMEIVIPSAKRHPERRCADFAHRSRRTPITTITNTLPIP